MKYLHFDVQSWKLSRQTQSVARVSSFGQAIKLTCGTDLNRVAIAMAV